MSVHKLNLSKIPFEAIESGSKTIESRLYDEKRKKIAVGDTIEFTNRDNPEQTITAIVTQLHRYNSFHELFTQNDVTKFGGDTVWQLEDQINKFYSADQQNTYGVVGIEFVLKNEA